MLRSIVFVCLFVCGVASAEDEAALTARAEKAFRNLRSGDKSLRSLRLEASVPTLGGSVRIRLAYRSPGRHCLAVMSGDGKCPIAIATEAAMLVYHPARGEFLYSETKGPAMLRLWLADGDQLKFGVAISADNEEDNDPEASRIRIDVADLVKHGADLVRNRGGTRSVRIDGADLVYELVSEQGHRMVARMTNAATPSLTRVEFRMHDIEHPIFIVDRIEIDKELAAKTMPTVRPKLWKALAPMQDALAGFEGMDAEAAGVQAALLRRFLGPLAAYGALERKMHRRVVLPGADAEEWEAAVARHRALTPKVLELWRKEFGEALPATTRDRVGEIDDEVEIPLTVKPTDEEARSASALARKIRNVTSGPGGLQRIAFEGTHWSQGKPVSAHRYALDGKRFAMQLDSADNTAPIVAADERNVLIYDASAGVLRNCPDTRCGAYLHSIRGYASLAPRFNATAEDAPRVSLLFKDILEQYPNSRRAYPDPTRKGVTLLEATSARNDWILFACDLQASPIVREIQTRWPGELKRVILFRVCAVPNKFPRIDLGHFLDLRVEKLDLTDPGPRWRARWSTKSVPAHPYAYLVMERIALKDKELRKYFPQLDESHWTRFAELDKELTPLVTKIWRKAFGTLR